MSEPTLPGADEAAPLGDLHEGTRTSAGGYALDRRVGSDAYGDIYVGLRDDDRRVVTLLSNRIIIDVVAARRFGAEVNRISVLRDAGILATIDFDLEADPRWIASEFVAGQFLRQRIETGGALSPPAIRALADQLARALQGLHALGVVQRDLSPDSVLLSRDGARLWHSGWAGLVDGSEYAGTVHAEHVEWLAPEQVLGEASTPASDVHAWAVTVLYAATGYNPFEAPKASESVSRLIRDTPLIPALFDPVLASLIAGALSKDPDARPTSRDLLLYLAPGTPLVDDQYESPESSVVVPDDPPVEVLADVAEAAAPTLTVSLLKTNGVSLLKPSRVEPDESSVDSVSETDSSLAIRLDKGDKTDKTDDIDDFDDADDQIDSVASDGTERRIGFPIVGLLGVIVVAVGAVLGIFIGRALGG